jgi:MFS family permease
MDKRGEKPLNLRDESAGDKIVFKDIKAFKPTFWYVTFLCLTFYAAVFPFQSLSTDFFHTKWGIVLSAPSSGGFLAQVFNNFLHITSTAGGLTSIIIFASMILAPFAGRLVDRVGKRTTFMVVGALLLIPCHLAMGLTRIYPVYPMILLGFSFVLVPAALWPSVPLIVRSERVGTAFGLMTAIQNIGLGLFPLLNGLLRDKTGSYVASEVMFASLGIFGFIFAMLLKRADRHEGHVLDAGPKVVVH